MLTEDERWYRVSLLLIGDRLPVDSISAKLQIEASYIGRMGEHLRGNPRYAKHWTNTWNWDFPADRETPFEEQLPGFLDRLEPVKDALRELLTMEGVTGEVRLGFGSGNGQGGADIPASVVRRIAELGLSLGIGLYPPDIEQREDEENNLVLLRPVNQEERDGIVDNGYKAFPSHLITGPRFYCVMDGGWPLENGREWSPQDTATGEMTYLASFRVGRSFLAVYPRERLAESGVEAYGIPLADLAKLNRHLVGAITLATIQWMNDQPLLGDLSLATKFLNQK